MNTLMVALGMGIRDDVRTIEVIDLSGSDKVCKPLPDSLLRTNGATGTFFNERPLVCGGFLHLYSKDNTPACFEYLKSSNSWTESSKIVMSRARQDPASVVLPDGSWWITGGYGVSK